MQTDWRMSSLNQETDAYVCRVYTLAFACESDQRELKPILRKSCRVELHLSRVPMPRSDGGQGALALSGPGVFDLQCPKTPNHRRRYNNVLGLSCSQKAVPTGSLLF